MGQCLPVASAVQLSLFFLNRFSKQRTCLGVFIRVFLAGESCRRLCSDMRGELYLLLLDGGLVHAQTPRHPFPVSIVFVFLFPLAVTWFLHLTV